MPRRWLVIPPLLMVLILACWLWGAVRADYAPAVVIRQAERGALLAWVNPRDADSLTVRRCHQRVCVFVDIVATAPGRAHTLTDLAALPGDTYYLSAYRARAGGLDFVADDGPYPVPAWVLLPQIAH